MNILCVITILYIIGAVIFWVYCNTIFGTGSDRKESRFIDSAIAVMSVLWLLTIIILLYDKIVEKKK